MNIETYSANVRTMYEAVKYAAVTDKQTEGYVEAEVLPEIASGTAPENVGTMDEEVADYAVTYQQKE